MTSRAREHPKDFVQYARHIGDDMVEGGRAARPQRPLQLTSPLLVVAIQGRDLVAARGVSARREVAAAGSCQPW